MYYVENDKGERRSPVSCDEALVKLWLGQCLPYFEGESFYIVFAEQDEDIPYPLINDDGQYC